MASKVWTVVVLALVVFFVVIVVREVNAPDPHRWYEVTPSGQPPPLTTAGIPEPVPEVPAGLSAFIALGLGNVAMTGMLLSALALAAFHRRRARAQKAFDPRAPLRDGSRMIAGEVESLPGHEGPVVEIEIDQRGAEQPGKNRTTHTWDEIDRRVRVSPFMVIRNDGTRVRVEPDDQVVLENGLAVIADDKPKERTQRATLNAGAQVHINGELRGSSTQSAREDAYRGASGGPVLGPPRFGRMVISAERPGETEERRARFHTRWAIALALIFAGLAGLLVPSYELLTFDGKVVMAEVDGRRVWSQMETVKGRAPHLVTYHGVRARLPGKDGSFTSAEADCDGALYTCVEEGKCTHVPFVVSAHLPSVHQLGTRPSLGVGRCVVIVLLSVLLGFAYITSTIETRPWYMKKKLDETGSGPLPRPKA